MPITPLHFGPGAALHASAPRHVSFLAFCAANVLIDIEPLYYMATGQYPLHRFFHSYIGASCILLATGLLFMAARALAKISGLRPARALRALAPRAIWIGAAAGAYSHVVLDSIMHDDMAPLAPISRANALYGLVPADALNMFCLAAAIIGLWLLEWRAQHRPGTARRDGEGVD